jgi:hypothetical protein
LLDKLNSSKPLSQQIIFLSAIYSSGNAQEIAFLCEKANSSGNAKETAAFLCEKATCRKENKHCPPFLGDHPEMAIFGSSPQSTRGMAAAPISSTASQNGGQAHPRRRRKRLF